MQRFWIGVSQLTFIAGIAAGCALERPTTATPPTDAAFARPSATPAYTATDIGAGFDGRSQANGVNDAGDVVGEVSSAAGFRAFAIIAGVATLLPGEGRASGISNGSPRYVVGFAGRPSWPARWTVDGGPPSGPTFLTLLTDEVVGERSV